MKKQKTTKTNRSTLALVITSLAFITLTACGDSSSSSAPQTSENAIAVFTSDFNTGELRFIGEDGEYTDEKISFIQDSKIFSVNGNLYVLERYGADNISMVKNGKVEFQVSLEDGANPSDLVAIDSKEGWLSQEGSTELLKIDLATGKTKKNVSLKNFVVKGNVSPNAVNLEILGDTLFVLMQRLDQFAATLPGLIAMFNANDGKLLDTISLKTPNPTSMTAYNGQLYVSTLGSYNSNYGTDADNKRGIEKISISKKSSELLVTGKDLGAGIYNMAVNPDKNIAYVTVYSEYGNAPLKAIDLESKKISAIKGINDAEGGMFFDSQKGLLYVGDRTAGSESLKIYDGKEVKTVTGNKVLPPYSIAPFSQVE
ncbi:MAG: hypothetical protein HUK21_08515 [Fibrobacteraceae bacterium]|nr:hypothetical protein [Fibrobacteraceae bacterium]